MSLVRAPGAAQTERLLMLDLAAPDPVEASTDSALAQVRRLEALWRDASATEVLRSALTGPFAGRAALLSSFGAESAVALHLLSQVDPATPVLFLDTGMHFAQTAQHRDALVRRLGLTDVRTISPEDAPAVDPRGDLWRRDPDACCDLRKVRPLAAALPGFDLLIGGRKRFHGEGRARLPRVERIDGQLRLNLLADWDGPRLEAYRLEHDLPAHPLVAAGFRSIGCWPCTQAVDEAGDGVRAGRWAGQAKTECGIHLPRRAAAG